MGDSEKFMTNAENITGNEGLPVGTKKFENQEADRLLQEMWNQEIELYEKYQRTINLDVETGYKKIPGLERFEIEISGHDSKTFKGILHPKVEGRSWFRGIAVQVDPDNPSNQVLIFSGWMQPWLEESPAPIVYTTGYITPEIVRTVIQRYTTGISSYIDRLRASYPNQENK